VNRIAKKTLESVIKKADWASEQASLLVGDAGDERSNPGRIRRFYTASYKDLDFFDKEWYSCFYDKRDQNWEINYVWSIVMTTVVNGRSAYNEDNRLRETMKDFARALVKDIHERVNNM
jgi:hypothetical protein